MARDDELITRTVQDYFEGWHDADAARMDRALHPCGDYLHLIRTSDGWKIGNALWLRT